VFGWLLRLFRRSPATPASTPSTETATPTATTATASTTATTATTASTTAPATSGAGGEAGFGDILAESDFDPAARDKEGGVWWKPKPPKFKAAERADVASCDPDEVGTLASTIISELLASIDKVPPFPVVANKLIELSSQPDVRSDLVERLVVQDAVIAAKVISAANSPFYGLTTRVETVDHAIRVVGLREVSQIAIAAAAAAIFDTQERVAFEAMTEQQQAAWSHSLVTARGASWLAMWLGADVQRAYIAGLLHDIGKPVALRGIGFALINGRLMEPPSSALAMAAVEAAHTDVGSMLADSWTLGDEMAAIIEGHHNDDADSMLSRLVRLASAVDEIRTNPAQRDNLQGTIVSVAQALGLNSEKVNELADEIERASSIRM
jgi:putative nucleotidyltransferase with HDIG domain